MQTSLFLAYYNVMLSPITHSHSIEIEIHDAVNAVMPIKNHELVQMGSNLGLDQVRVEEIISHYGLDEQHQRLVELWFKQVANPTWEKLCESLPSHEHHRGSPSSYNRESSMFTSKSSVPITVSPTSPTGTLLCQLLRKKNYVLSDFRFNVSF